MKLACCAVAQCVGGHRASLDSKDEMSEVQYAIQYDLQADRQETLQCAVFLVTCDCVGEEPDEGRRTELANGFKSCWWIVLLCGALLMTRPSQGCCLLSFLLNAGSYTASM